MRRRNDEKYVELAAARQTRLRRTAYLMCGDRQQAAASATTGSSWSPGVVTGRHAPSGVDAAVTPPGH